MQCVWTIWCAFTELTVDHLVEVLFLMHISWSCNFSLCDLFHCQNLNHKTMKEMMLLFSVLECQPHTETGACMRWVSL